MKFYIATIWSYNGPSAPDDCGHFLRYIDRRQAASPIDFRQTIEREYANDDDVVGVISLSKDQTSPAWWMLDGEILS